MFLALAAAETYRQLTEMTIEDMLAQLDIAREQHYLAEDEVNTQVDQLQADFRAMASNIARINAAFRPSVPSPSVPSIPTRSPAHRSNVSRTQPSTPTRTGINQPAARRAMSSAPTSPSLPSTIQSPTEPASSFTVYPGSRKPAYIVYYGNNAQSGFFMLGMGRTSLVPYASAICDPDDRSQVFKGFGDPGQALKLWNEFSQSKAAEVIAQKLGDNECFVLIEGVNPGVYKTRKNLIMDGLVYGGGVAVRYVGDISGAWAHLNKCKRDGRVKKFAARRILF
ncbi:hypothetical protein D9758_016089 [Tetrapyrgos nigripes]|uniref:Uncharacterized protein n=1 Tax=Tetrapyrgos nigripes TaxID=182062 RepID=A0A8H5CLI1_9AGAR|nr:hypothetical protein D9758_016089 [Tetrapyrgos nigripes]